MHIVKDAEELRIALEKHPDKQMANAIVGLILCKNVTDTMLKQSLDCLEIGVEDSEPLRTAARTMFDKTFYASSELTVMMLEKISNAVRDTALEMASRAMAKEAQAPKGKPN